ncbi:CASP-like protein [Artemisia annua]|uniref:CASP-like protein n=1 Tax=Artemisia annua TaxID=35608 RepID=A0A2U1PYU2_ARTAN|nr:CASP-like protein [Artemisia annua]
MSSFDTIIPTQANTVKSSGSPPEYKSSTKKFEVFDAALRVLLFATALVAIIVMATSKQTKVITLLPGMTVPVVAKFDQSPAFIYFVAALSVACLYSIITVVLSILASMKKGGDTSNLHFYFMMFDVLLLGIVASATSAAGGVAYIGLKGNSHTGWAKICNVYGSFCFHVAASIVLSLISSITLLLLVWLSIYVLFKKITRR